MRVTLPVGSGKCGKAACMNLDAAREVVSVAATLSSGRMNIGTSGNVSSRHGSGAFIITPSGVPALEIAPADCVLMDLSGAILSGASPSTEWRMHRAIYASHRRINGVVHCHSTRATAVACGGQGLPAFHYQVAAAGGNDVPCVPYARFGTEELAVGAAAALTTRDACLLANHGLVTVGVNLKRALELAVEVEWLCEVFLNAGRLSTIPADEMTAVAAAYAAYRERR